MANRSVQPLAPRRHSGWRRACAVLAVPAVLLAWSGRASAQGWLSDRRLTEGQGIRTGDFELHPGIGAEAGYDSNWFRRSSKSGPNIANGAPALPPQEAGVFRVTPSLFFATQGQTRLVDGVLQPAPRSLVLSGGVAATGRLFLGSAEVRRQNNVSVTGDLRMHVNPEGLLGFVVSGAYARVIQPQVYGSPDQSYNRNDVRGLAEVVARPGGGNLDLRAGYGISVSLFEETHATPYTNVSHQISFKDRWLFRPRTSLFHETTLQFITYPNAARSFNYLQNSTPLRTRIGVNGLLTDRVGVLLAGGYGATFFSNAESVITRQYDSLNAQVEGTYFFSPGPQTDEPGKATLLLSSVALGATRDFHTSLISNFYTSTRVYLNVGYTFGNKVVVRFQAHGDKLDYPPVYVNAGATPARVTNDFSNLRVGGSIFGEYRFTPSLGVNTTINYTQQFSDTQIPTAVTAAGTPTPLVYDLNYQRLQVFGGVRYFF